MANYIQASDTHCRSQVHAFQLVAKEAERTFDFSSTTDDNTREKDIQSGLANSRSTQDSDHAKRGLNRVSAQCSACPHPWCNTAWEAVRGVADETVLLHLVRLDKLLTQIQRVCFILGAFLDQVKDLLQLGSTWINLDQLGEWSCHVVVWNFNGREVGRESCERRERAIILAARSKSLNAFKASQKPEKWHR